MGLKGTCSYGSCFATTDARNRAVHSRAISLCAAGPNRALVGRSAYFNCRFIFPSKHTVGAAMHPPDGSLRARQLSSARNGMTRSGSDPPIGAHIT